jgi:hypothetical protein
MGHLPVMVKQTANTHIKIIDGQQAFEIKAV